MGITGKNGAYLGCQQKGAIETLYDLNTLVNETVNAYIELFEREDC